MFGCIVTEEIFDNFTVTILNDAIKALFEEFFDFRKALGREVGVIGLVGYINELEDGKVLHLLTRS